jgi:hypothetical protein
VAKPAISANLLHVRARIYHAGMEDNAEGSSNPTNLTGRQRAVLVGTLLGDGCLAKHGRFHRLHVKHKAAHRVLAEFKRDVFTEFVGMPLHEFDQQLGGKSYPCVQFATRTSPLFTEWYARFYRAGRKVVPHNIASYLTPLSLTVWFMDDGAADHAGATFQTHSFTGEEVHLLIETLQRRFDLALNPRRNRGRWIIYVKSVSMRRLNEILAPHLLPGFAYKIGLEPRRGHTLAPDSSGQGDDMVRARR